MRELHLHHLIPLVAHTSALIAVGCGGRSGLDVLEDDVQSSSRQSDDREAEEQSKTERQGQPPRTSDTDNPIVSEWYRDIVSACDVLEQCAKDFYDTSFDSSEGCYDYFLETLEYIDDYIGPQCTSSYLLHLKCYLSASTCKGQDASTACAQEEKARITDCGE